MPIEHFDFRTVAFSRRDRDVRWIRRWAGLIGIAGRRVFAGVRRGRIGLSILSVALAIGMLILVASLAMGLSAPGAVPADDASYTVVPEGTEGTNPIAAIDNPQFGGTHEAAERMADHEHVLGATPVLVHLESIDTADGGSTRVLVIGVTPDEHASSVAGIPTGELDPAMPYYASNRSEDAWTGEAVLSVAGSEVIGIGEGDAIDGLHPEHHFTVVNVAEDRGSPLSGTPVLVVHLAELQHVTDLEEHDQAHQFMVAANASAAEDHLASIYPSSSVSTQSGLMAQGVTAGGLPTALAGTALVVAFLVGGLFVMTAMGLDVTADARQLATLAAVGFSGRSRTGIVAAQTLIITLIGGIGGVLLGYGGIVAIELGEVGIAVGRPWWLAPVGLAVAVAIGLVTIPYLALLQRRMSYREDLR